MIMISLSVSSLSSIGVVVKWLVDYNRGEAGVNLYHVGNCPSYILNRLDKNST